MFYARYITPLRLFSRRGAVSHTCRPFESPDPRYDKSGRRGHAPREEKNDDAVTNEGEEDKALLRNKLLIVRKACAEYDKTTAEDALIELRNNIWSQSTKKLLGVLSEHLLHADFENVVDLVDAFLGGE